ncbi:ribonuclease E/G [Bacillota bacterium Meth-B3]|nr:Rne/Rng family ribonuclease [Christensenellaceae bacterium]
MKQLLLESRAGQTRLALLEDGSLSELYVEREGREKLVGNLYLGRAMNVLPGMQAAFVDIGLSKNGFLYAGDIQLDRRSLGPDAAALEQALSGQSISKLIRPGQEVLVQVVKEPGGDKGPRLSMNATLPGRMAVLLPTLSYVGVSRRIESPAERDRLRALAERLKPQGMGLIVRTAADGAGEEALARDIAYLVRLWDSIVERARYAIAPSLVHRDLSLTHRAVRDMLLPDVESLTVDGESALTAARAHAAMLSDELPAKIRPHSDSYPLFEAHRIDAQTEKALGRKVWLKSGGYLVFDYAEALTVIDVNTGRYVGRKTLSDTVFEINREAASEIARQLRLRDIGGIIVIDFIDMDLDEHREALLAHFAQALKRDRTKTNLVGLTGLGLVEMTRKKVHQPLHTILTETCPTCQGSGRVVNGQAHKARKRTGENHETK